MRKRYNATALTITFNFLRVFRAPLGASNNRSMESR